MAFTEGIGPILDIAPCWISYNIKGDVIPCRFEWS